MKPLVSILIPAYNAERFLEATLRSAVAQTWKRCEIIVVDDGSTDRTHTIARRFENQGVRVFAQSNGGAAAARNAAYSLCSGDYIQWLDADDLLAPDKIARQLEALGSIPAPCTLLSSSWGAFLHRAHAASFRPTALWCDLSPVEWLVRKMGQNLYMQTATWLVSRELSDAAGPWNTTLLGDDDGEYFCRVLLNCERVRFVAEARVYYRSVSGSLSYIGRLDRKMEAQWRSMELHIGYLRQLEDSGRTLAACVCYLQNWTPFFWPDRPDLIRRAECVASECGGRLTIPLLSWKYRWINALWGPHAAKWAQVVLPMIRWSLVRRWNGVLFQWEGLQFKAGADAVPADEITVSPVRAADRPNAEHKRK